MAADTQSEQPRLRPWVPMVGVLVGVLIVGGIVAVPFLLRFLAGHITLPSTGEQEAPPPVAKLDKRFAKSMDAYTTAPVPPPAIPVAQPVTSAEPKAAPVTQANIFSDMVNFLPWGSSTKQAVSPQQTTQTAPIQEQSRSTTPVQEKAAAVPKEPKKKAWAWLASGEQQTAAEAPVAKSEEERTALATVGKASGLIEPANWAIPADPLKTLYRSMLIPGVLLDAINSDIPSSTIKMLIPWDVVDKFGYNTVIIAHGSKIIAAQAGKPEFGQSRLPLKISQIELPTGEIVGLDGDVGGPDGAAGVPGRVDAHIPSLLLATGINAVLNIGVRSLAGTPGRNQFYQDPVQGAAQDIGQSIAQDARQYTNQVLKVAPTIRVTADDIKKGKGEVTITLLKNIQFNRKPVVIR